MLMVTILQITMWSYPMHCLTFQHLTNLEIGMCYASIVNRKASWELKNEHYDREDKKKNNYELGVEDLRNEKKKLEIY